MAKKEDGSFERDLIGALKVEKGHEGAVRIGSDQLDADVEDYISTQCATLDWALARPGVPVGRMTLLLGEEATGKSTILLHILIETQRRGGTAILVDAENRYSKERATEMGMDHDRLVYVTGDQPYESILKRIIELIDKARVKDKNRLIAIGLDSLAAVAGEKSISGESDQIASVAMLTSKFFREHLSTFAAKRVCFVVVNQWRANINAFGGGWASQKTMIAPGACRFYSTCRIEFKKKAVLPDKDHPEAILVGAEVTKNTIAPPYRTAEFLISFRFGIDFPGSQLLLAKQLGLVSQGGGGYYELEGREKKFRAGEFEEVLAEHPELVERLVESSTDWTRAERA